MDGASHQSPQIIRAEEVDGIRPVRLESAECPHPCPCCLCALLMLPVPKWGHSSATVKLPTSCHSQVATVVECP